MEMEDNIKNKTINALMWKTVEKILVKGSAFLISVVLARVLMPADYGLIGMLAIFISISAIFIESGFAKALIQKKNCNDIDFSTAFYTNIGISLIIYLFFYICAPLVAKFYEEPLLSAVLRILSINFVIGAFNVVQRAKLMAQLDFKSLAKINFVGVIVGGICGIIMAYMGLGVWALVGQSLASTVVMLFFFPYYSHWKPLFVFSMVSFKKLFGFGSKLLIQGTVTTIVNNITTISIGKAYKSDQLGYYTTASQLSDTIAWTLNDILGTVTFPVLSKLQDDKSRFLNVYKKSLFYSALCVFPVMALMALLSESLVLVLYTEKWLPCTILLQILCLARMFTPLSAINMSLLNALGRSDLFMWVDLCKVPIILVTLAITIPMGVKAIVIGNLIVSIISFFINAYYPGKLLKYGAVEQIIDFKDIFFSMILMSIVVFAIAHFIHTPILKLLVCGCVGLLVYITSCICLKVVSVSEVKSILHH